MLYENRKLDRAFEFIKNAPFDIFCLQEVPEKFLKRLETLPFHISYSVEVVLVAKTHSFPLYCVTLSKYSFIQQGEVSFEDSLTPIRSRIVSYILNFLNSVRVIKKSNRKGFYADIKLANGSLRIFNLHLPLTYPAQRIKELKQVLQHHNPDQQSIVCGDFNILETFHISMLNWLLGGSVTDWFFYKNERNSAEEYFKELGFANPLHKYITHPISQSQLDHILIPHSALVTNTSVLSDRIGSDHAPVRVEINL